MQLQFKSEIGADYSKINSGSTSGGVLKAVLTAF
jgi:hypothetical protein